MVDVPLAKALTKPALLIVATVVLLDTQAFEDAGVPVPDSCEVAFRQRTTFPVIVGKALTVIVEVLEHPILFVYVMIVVPAVTPVTRPV
jgi:hypothetical protein